MKSEEFEYYLGAYGTDLTVWPENARARALLALRSDRQVQGRYRAETEFERQLTQISIEPASHDFVARILETSFNGGSRKRGLAPEPSVFQTFFRNIKSVVMESSLPMPVYTLLAFAFFGFVVGFALWNAPHETSRVLHSLFGGETMSL